MTLYNLYKCISVRHVDYVIKPLNKPFSSSLFKKRISVDTKTTSYSRMNRCFNTSTFPVLCGSYWHTPMCEVAKPWHMPVAANTSWPWVSDSDRRYYHNAAWNTMQQNYWYNLSRFFVSIWCSFLSVINDKPAWWDPAPVGNVYPWISTRCARRWHFGEYQ